MKTTSGRPRLPSATPPATESAAAEQAPDGAAVEQSATVPALRQAAAQFPPVGDLAFLADREVAALVAPSGNVEWLCLPDMDSSSVFGALLDRSAGRFRVGPADVMVPADQRYVVGSMVLETAWMTRSGLLVVRDALTISPWAVEQRAPSQRRPPGDGRAEHLLLRTMECVQGHVTVSVDCEPMFDFGRHAAGWSYEGAGYHTARATGADGETTLRLGSSLRLGFEGGRAAARATLRQSERAFVALSWADGDPPETIDDAFLRIERTSEFWRLWVGSGRFPDHPWRAHLHRSALTLKALTYAPTGAIAAAPTTSLPRVPGGSRNWDLRYTFVRDSAWALRALYALGFAWEADDYLAFLAEVSHGERPLQSLYRLNGENPPEEAELAHLRGYGGAVPVRVGNAAVSYAQHDVGASLVDAAAVPALGRRRLPSAIWAMVRREVEHLASHWQEPDRGFWTLRAAPRHYTSSKVMSWVAADRGAALADLRGRPELASAWRELAAEIERDVLEHAVSSHGTFKEHYESDELDASLLVIPLVGFLPGHDPRVGSTVAAIEEELTFEGLALRRRPRAGEPVTGEAFTVCSWWLVSALVSVGQVQRARALAERLLAYQSRLGLYAEQVDPMSGRHLGNFPHALTHVAQIDALLRLIHAER